MNALMAIPIAVMNTLWQAALLAAIVWLALRVAPRMNAATRFALWWAALGVVAILPAAPRLIAFARESFQPATIRSTRPLYAPVPIPSQVIDLAPAVTVVETRDSRWPFGAAAAWALIFLYRLVRLARSYAYLRGLKRRARLSSQPLPPTGRTALLLLSPEIDSPVAVGFVRPAVILPSSLVAELSPEEMEHVVLHEAAHLARWDDWNRLLARVLGGALRLHPVAWWILRRIEVEREAACDDWVVARTKSATQYARSLTRVYELLLTQRQGVPGKLLAAGIFGGDLFSGRIETLLRHGRNFTPRISRARLATGIAVVVALGAVASLSPRWIAFAQAPRPAFDVASIKRHIGETNGVTFAAREGGRLEVVNNPIFNVIDNAYGIRNYQLIGAPDWVSSERYDIEASGPATAGQKEMMLMLQTLLADRFAMKAHFEMREMPAYILTVAKGGSKLHLLGSEDCVPYDGTRPNPETVPNVCGNNLVSRNNVWRGTHISMRGVTGVLSSTLRRPVIDQTGIKGTFDVSLQWTDDLALADKPDDAPPSIYAALKEALGLDLKPGHGPAEVLVIDQIQRPSAN
jgi:bla regulator protein blaR1